MMALLLTREQQNNMKPTRRTQTQKQSSLQEKVAEVGSKSAVGQTKTASRSAKPSQTKAFAGKVFYLDLPSNKKAVALENDIQQLGGIVEKFFSKDIKYLVSNKREAKYVHCLRKDLSFSGPDSGHSSPLPRPSPPQQAASHRDPQGLNDAVVTSRGRALVEKVVKKEQERIQMNKILSNALEWGVKILYFDDVLAYVEKKKNNQSTVSTAVVQKVVKVQSSARPAFQKCKGGRIARPFVKVEDSSRHYRPVYLTMSTMPELNLKTLPPCTPFCPQDKKPREHGAETSEERGHARAKRNRDKKKAGYCECCLLKYDNLAMHLKGERHKAFSMSDDEYLVVDRLVSTLDCNFRTMTPIHSKTSRSKVSVSPIIQLPRVHVQAQSRPDPADRTEAQCSLQDTQGGLSTAMHRSVPVRHTDSDPENSALNSRPTTRIHTKASRSSVPALLQVPEPESQHDPADSKEAQSCLRPSKAELSTVKSTEAEPSTVKPTEAEPSTVKPTEAEPSTVKPTEAEPSTVKPTEAEPSTVKPTEAELSTVKPTEAEPSTVKPTEAEPSTVKPTEAEPSTVKPTEAEPSTVKPTEAEPSTVKPTEAEPSTVKPTEAEPSTVKPTEAEPSTVKPTEAEPSTVKPTAAEPSTVKPTAAEPSTVKPTAAELSKPSEVEFSTVKLNSVSVSHTDADPNNPDNASNTLYLKHGLAPRKRPRRFHASSALAPRTRRPETAPSGGERLTADSAVLPGAPVSDSRCHRTNTSSGEPGSNPGDHTDNALPDRVPVRDSIPDGQVLAGDLAGASQREAGVECPLQSRTPARKVRRKVRPCKRKRRKMESPRVTVLAGDAAGSSQREAGGQCPSQSRTPVRKIQRKVRLFKRKRQETECPQWTIGDRMRTRTSPEGSLDIPESILTLWHLFQSSEEDTDLEFLGFED